MPKTASPFRYPGGKSQLYKFIEHLLYANNIDGTYVEPFAGGAGLPIKLLLNHKVNDIWINDYDKAIFSVWHAILNNPTELISMIKKVPFDYESGYLTTPEKAIEFWKHQKEVYLKTNDHQNSIALAFSTLFLNRTNKSGIIQAGPIGGIQQNGTTKIFARFNKQTLINKIISINSMKQHIRLTRTDALKMTELIKEEMDQSNCFVFFDPPYYDQGKKLYFSSFDENGHAQLSKEILGLNDFKWITTYDKMPQITQLYESNLQSFEYQIRYSANNKKRGKAPELLFASPNLNISSFDNVNLTSIQ